MRKEKGLNELFFELIQVAVGYRLCLSYSPSADEWGELYAMAKKQSLVGVCFAGVQNLITQDQTPPKMLYLTWMGMSAKIQQRNEQVNRECTYLQVLLADKGYKSCILKGQGVAQIYGQHLCNLRQSGDIDIWIEGGFYNTLKLVDILGKELVVAEHHVDLPILVETNVEAHFIPSYLRSPWHNKRLQKWFCEQAPIQFNNKNERGWCVPTTEFNLVFLMLHAFRHFTSEGIGLRQVMDYFSVQMSATPKQRKSAYDTLCQFGVKSFCGAMMYVLQVVMGVTQANMICKPDFKEGKYLLNEIMNGGNFGHFDNRVKAANNESKIYRYLRQTHRNMHQMSHYPAEAFFSPIWRAKIWVWRKWNGWI